MVTLNDALALWIEEDGLEYVEKALARWAEKAEQSYEQSPNTERRHCPLCGQLMVAGSMSYWEGYHFDSCY